MKNILMFVNPSARHGQQFLEEINNWLLEHGYKILNPTFDPKKDHICSLIEKHATECTAVLIGGGDGSINQALPALMKTQIPLLVIPLGTANNLARTLKLPANHLDALELLNKNVIQDIDVGLANNIPFINVIGLGLSTQVNRMTRSDYKRWFGVFAFIFTAFKVGMRMTPFFVKITYDEKTHFAHTWQLTVCNGRNYGSGLVIHEEASLVDQKLHGLSTEVKKWWHAFFLIPNLLIGRFNDEVSMTTFESEKILIETRRRMHVDVDGDIKTLTPVEVKVQSKALKIYVQELLLER